MNTAARRIDSGGCAIPSARDPVMELKTPCVPKFLYKLKIVSKPLSRVFNSPYSA